MAARVLTLLALLLALTIVVSGCGDDGGGANGGTDTTLTSEEPTEGPPPVTTGESQGANLDPAAITAYERGFSTCASERMVDLAVKHGVPATREAVVEAVAKDWGKRLGDPSGKGQITESAEDGCLTGFRQG